MPIGRKALRRTRLHAAAGHAGETRYLRRLGAGPDRPPGLSQGQAQRDQSASDPAQALRSVRQYPPGEIACPDCRRCTRMSISSSCARTTRASRPTAMSSRATGEFRPDARHDDFSAGDYAPGVGARWRARRSSWRARVRARKLTAVHKDTVFKLGCGMFAEECRKLAQEFPDIAFDEVMVDTIAHEAGDETAAVRRHRHHQHFRRYPVRRGGRTGRRAGAGAGPVGGAAARDGAGHARFRARHRGQGHRQSLCDDHVGADVDGVARTQAWRAARGKSVRS